MSITLPDGGDAIGLIVALYVVPLSLLDGRRWHWKIPQKNPNPAAQGIAYVISIALRAQMALIYLDAGISKMAVKDWANGSAEYYILRDSMFGISGPLARPMLALTEHASVTLAITWGAIAIEIAIGALLLMSHRWRIAALVLDLLLHVSIILTMGLFSFATVMLGAATAAANPALARRGRQNTEPAYNLEHIEILDLSDSPRPSMGAANGV